MATSDQISSNILKLGIIRMLFWMHFFGAVLIPFFTQWGGLKLSQVMLLNAWFMLWSFLLEVPTGALADRLGRKKSLALGALAGMLAIVIYVAQPRIGFFLLGEVLFAIAFALHSGADEALAYDSLLATNDAATAQKVMARLESFKLAGIILGTLSGGLIAARWGLTAPMIAYLIPLALCFLLTLTLVEPPHVDRTQKRSSYRETIRRGSNYFFNHKELRRLTIELVTTNALCWTIIWLGQPNLGNVGVPITAFGFVQAAGCLGQILFLAQAAGLEKRVGSKRGLMLLQGLGAGSCFLLLAWSKHPLWTVLAIMIAYALGLSRPALFSAYLNQHIPSAERATLLSFVSMFRTLAIVVVHPLVGLLADHSLPATMGLLGLAILFVTALDFRADKARAERVTAAVP